jgi:type IV secretory pathway VirB10-like protein
MTERKEPDDRELEQYLEGGSKLSRRYRDASSEAAPPELDEIILARARAELRRKPSLNRLLAPVAVAASVVLGVNLAWNVWQAAPVPTDATLQKLAEKAHEDGILAESPPVTSAPQPAAEAPAAAPQAPVRRKAEAMPEPVPKERRENEADLAAAQREQKDADQAKAQERAAFAAQAESQRRAMKAQDSAGVAAPYVESAPAPAAALADAPVLSEAQKIDHLINHIGSLAGATFIRNGKEYGATEAAKHLQAKREKAGDRVKTADDFIRLCASHSYVSGEAYLIRFADGRTRTAEDVLREELAKLQ